MSKEIEITEKCPDCQVHIGECHVRFCDVTRCKVTGYQMLSCYADPEEIEDGEELDHECEATIWTGEWPGVKVCRENGWYTSADSPWGVSEDLNSVPFRAEWNSELEDWKARK